MRNDLKLLVYAAAGVGMYAVLKRYGILNDVGRWLSDQVPEDYKRQAAHAYKQAKQHVGEAGDFVKDQAGKVTEQVKDRVADIRGGSSNEDEDSKSSGRSQSKSASGGGKVEETQNPDGSTASHRVGRGAAV